MLDPAWLQVVIGLASLIATLAPFRAGTRRRRSEKRVRFKGFGVEYSKSETHDDDQT
tara:strand:+ start:5220 stop:5390 length:171 start_codon:yes stop_codon:yes gene_type:complete